MIHYCNYAPNLKEFGGAYCCLVVHPFICFRAFLGPVVQSVVSLSSSLRVISLTVLADPIYMYNILKFFAEKM